MKNNEKGFSVVELLLIVVVVGLVGFVGWYVYDAKNAVTKKADNSQSSQEQKPNTAKKTTESEKKADPNEGYLVVKEWGVRFKVPSTLKAVEYQISGDTLGFYAKPADADVEYRSDYKALDDQGIPDYAIGILIRSTDSTKLKTAEPVEGKKLGDHYYYTWHSFSSLATGASGQGLYYDADCLQNDSSAECSALYQLENDAWRTVNEEGGLLRSIELAQ